MIVRGDRACRFPSNVQLVATAAPCPCGHADTARCVCSAETLARHQRRLSLSLSLLDRFVIVIDLPAEVDVHAAPAPTSAKLRDRLHAARERRHRADAVNGGGLAAPTADGPEPTLTDRAWAAFYDARRVGSIGQRSGARILTVTQTVADLAGEDSITVESLDTALALGGRQRAPAPKLAC